jgi:hypothetical protein
MNSKIELDKAIIYPLGNSIVKLEFKPDVLIELVDANEINTTIYNLVDGKPFYSLIDVSYRYGSITNEARDFFAKDPRTLKIRQAEAFIITNLPMRILAKGYVVFNKTNNPVKFFKNESDALDWLHQLIDNTAKNKAI